MNRRDALLLAVAAATLAAVVVFVLHPPAPRYFPLEGVWRWGKVSGIPSMGWYGLSAWMFAAAAVVGACSYAFVRLLFVRSAANPRASVAWGAAAVTLAAFLAGAAYAVHHEWHRLETFF
jgi:hypothetical protein